MLVEGGASHPLAVVDRETCALGDFTMVWQFASVIRGAKIGMRCTIGAGAVVDGAHVGDETLIGAGAQLHPGTRIGKKVFVGPGVIFCNDLWPMVEKQGFEYPPADRATVILEDEAVIGAGAIILPGVVVSRGGMVSAGVVCAQAVPAWHILRRDGTVEPVPDDRTVRRMKWAG